MTEIKYKLVDGEPVCDSGCPRFDVENNFNSPKECGLVCGEGNPCIPGLRQQRDEAREQRDEARVVIDMMADEIVAARKAVGVDACYAQTKTGVIEEFRTLAPAPATGKDGE